MPKLALFLASFFSSVFAWLSAYLWSKVALVITITVVSMAMIVGLFVALKLLVTGVVSLIPYEPFIMAFFAIWPSNAEVCVAACWGADIAVFLYRYKMRILALVSQ